jgi:hypothetical protein
MGCRKPANIVSHFAGQSRAFDDKPDFGIQLLLQFKKGGSRPCRYEIGGDQLQLVGGIAQDLLKSRPEQCVAQCFAQPLGRSAWQ